jgi:hypothetical protein
MKNASIEGNKSLRFAMFKCLNVEAFLRYNLHSISFKITSFDNALSTMMGSGGIQIRIRICFYS